MRRLLSIVCLAVCTTSHAAIETWVFRDAEVHANPYDPGPAGPLNGFFEFDTVHNSIGRFHLDAGGTVIDSSDPAPPFCGSCTPTAEARSFTHLRFNTNLTPATNLRVDLLLTKSLASTNSPIALQTDSALYYNYGLSSSQISGAIVLDRTLAAVPEPGAGVLGIAGILSALLWHRLRRFAGTAA